MSEAPRARKTNTPARFLARGFLLVLGSLAFLMFVGPQDARALDLGGAVDQVAPPVRDVADQVAQPVRDVVGQVAQPVRDVVGQVVDPVRDVIGQIERELGQVVEPVRDLVRSPSGNQVERDTPLPGSPDEPAVSVDRPGTRNPAPEGAITASGPGWLAPLDEATLSLVRAGDIDTEFPTGSPWTPVGPSSASMGGLSETGGRGLPFNAALLAAALALAVALSRWLRLMSDGRAPNPFLSLVEVPG